MTGFDRGGKVTLKKRDGKTITVPLSKLSHKDRVYAIRHRQGIDGKIGPQNLGSNTSGSSVE